MGFCACSGATAFAVAEGVLSGDAVGEAGFEQAVTQEDDVAARDMYSENRGRPQQIQDNKVVEATTAATTTVAVAQVRWEVLENGVYESKFDGRLKNRTTNLEVASRTVDGTVIEAGAVFSFNEIVGLATEEKGYKKAKIFLKGEEVLGLGGGICQLSSAIYNAADYAGLEIVERHAHSMRVYYVPEGRDAATAYGGVDLKFKNNLNVAVRLRAAVGDGVLTVSLEKQIV